MQRAGISPDEIVFWSSGFVNLNATIVFTWVVMALLTVISWMITRKLSTGPQISRGQNLLEVVVGGVRDQIEEVARREAAPYLPFIGTLFIFIAACNLLSAVPGYQSPTGSLSTTAGLALCVMIVVIWFGVASRGWKGYLQQFLQPSPLMLPFNLLGEFSRTLALAVRLFGNVMSAAKIGVILLGVAPLFLPVLMDALGLLTGFIHAYIFALLATVYIASATHASQDQPKPQNGK